MARYDIRFKHRVTVNKQRVLVMKICLSKPSLKVHGRNDKEAKRRCQGWIIISASPL